MNRIDIIQSLIDKYKYNKYCEVGVQAGNCFNTIRCDDKVGIDPDKSSAATHHVTSDEFFANNKENFDIFFSDGLHHADQAEKDLNNMLKFLNEGGTIVVHDNLPTTKRMQEIPLQEQCEWTGNVWQTWVKFRVTRPDLEMRVVDTDWGVGIIRKGSQKCINIDPTPEEARYQEYYPTYEEFCIHKQEWMNIISVEDFKKIYL
jgi:hypothetical protein